VAFFIPNLDLLTSVMASVMAAIVITGLGMTSFHDASHYAVKEKNHFVNGFIMRFWGAIALWDPQMWLYHHTVRHHAFTGDEVFDPDTQHARPFVRKHPDAPRNKYFSFRGTTQRWVLALWAFVIYVLAPGMFIVQVISYHLIWRFKGHLWKMGTPRAESFERKWWEAALSGLMLMSHAYKFVDGGVMTGLAVTGAYICALNLTYAMCILPDHDTYESAIENRVDSPKVVDWGEVQVRHSSDFGGRGILGRAFSHFFGGINVQIAHHVFPGCSHMYLPEVALIIEDTCKEFNIPYASHPTFSGAVWSFVKTIHTCMGDDAVSVTIQ
jgi:fatty acid desaturase